jgi:uncharacterized LabA/DUF88 family protein
VDKAAVFIDGYNLYHGIVDANLRPWLWVDLCKLAYEVTPKSVRIDQVNYYTAHSKKQEGNSRTNQRLFISAQNICNPSGFRLVPGFMQGEKRRCGADCRKHYDCWAEKRTDVNLALDMAFGAAAGDFQLAVLISGDADQVETVKRTKAAGANVLAVFPPERHSNHLKDVADKSFVMKVEHLRAAQMDDALTKPDGSKVERPTAWGEREDYTGATGPPAVPHWPT